MDVTGPVSNLEILAFLVWGCFALGVVGYLNHRFGWDREPPPPPPVNRKRVAVPTAPVNVPVNRKR